MNFLTFRSTRVTCPIPVTLVQACSEGIVAGHVVDAAGAQHAGHLGKDGLHVRDKGDRVRVPDHVKRVHCKAAQVAHVALLGADGEVIVSSRLTVALELRIGKVEHGHV